MKNSKEFLTLAIKDYRPVTLARNMVKLVNIYVRLENFGLTSKVNLLWKQNVPTRLKMEVCVI